MRVTTAERFNLGTKETWLQSQIPDSFKSQAKEDVVDRFAGRLDEPRKSILENSLRTGSPQQKAQAFSDALELVQPGAPVRELYAATIEGLEHIQAEAQSPIVDLTAACSMSGKSCLQSAKEFHLANLVGATSLGLKEYAQDPNVDALTLATKLETKVTFMMDEMAPVLTEMYPELELPLEVIRAAALGGERGENGYDTKVILKEFASKPDPSIRHALATVFQARDFDNDYSFFETLWDLEYDTKSPEIRAVTEETRRLLEDHHANSTDILNHWRHS